MIASLMILTILLFISLTTGSNHHSTVDDPSTSNQAVDYDPDYLLGRYLLTGTIVWDRNVEAWSRVGGSIDPQQPFSGLATYSPELYDAWVADLECPTSSQDLPEEAGADHRLEFNCRQDYLDPAREYFEFFNLANNHSDNSGRDKLEETRDILSEKGFQHFGDPNPDNQEHACEVVGLPARLINTLEPSEKVQEARLPVAFCAWHYFYRRPLPGEMDIIGQYAKYMPVFTFIHMGAEYKPAADVIQRQIAHAAIDAGSEFVIGNNPHWVQDSEVYKGKLIVYSTGNFIFDQQFNQEVKLSANIDVELTAEYNQALQAWLDLGSACVVYQDDCLDQAREMELQRLPISLKYDVVAGDLNGRLQTRADQQVQAWVESRLRWGRVLH